MRQNKSGAFEIYFVSEEGESLVYTHHNLLPEQR
jgi:hypothetical protein